MPQFLTHIHAAVPHASPAAVAAALIHPHSYKTELVKKSVNCTERANETAEAAVAENAGKAYNQHDRELPRKEDAQHTKKTCVARIGQEADRPFKCSRRTNILAESRHRNIVRKSVPERKTNTTKITYFSHVSTRVIRLFLIL